MGNDDPQSFFPRAFIRFIRYDGIEAKVGKDMNVVKDVIFDGRILEQVKKAVDFIKIQMKEKTYLGHDGIFVTEEEYSESGLSQKTGFRSGNNIKEENPNEEDHAVCPGALSVFHCFRCGDC